MKNQINLNSSDWCDIVFEKRNKEYGAYVLRQSSWKLHSLAFICTVAFAALITVTPDVLGFINNKTKTEDPLAKLSDYQLSDLNKPEKVVEVIIPEKALPEPPKLAKTIKFMPPEIVPDTEVTEANTMKAADEILNSDGVVATIDNAQGSLDKDAVIPDRPSVSEITGQSKSQDPFVSVEVMPQYPGGVNEMMKHIANNLKYPVMAQENGIQGRVTVRFVVDAKGKIDQVQILKGIDSACDKEALRVVKSMPKWIPGRQNGTPVSVYFTLPIIFKLKQ